MNSELPPLENLSNELSMEMLQLALDIIFLITATTTSSQGSGENSNLLILPFVSLAIGCIKNWTYEEKVGEVQMNQVWQFLSLILPMISIQEIFKKIRHRH